MDFSIKKYPRTPHLEGSRLQVGDEDLSQIPFEEICGKNIVIEEKIDGANTAISFDDNGELLLQSRGHYLRGGFKEHHYNLFKQWAMVHKYDFFNVLGSRYIMYGEWMYAKHTVYYDKLPHYFMEFDIYDREKGVFLDTQSRKNLIKDLPICSVPILASGKFKTKESVLKYIGPSNYISENHIENLKNEAAKQGMSAEQVLKETDQSNIMEGIYIKVEENGIVTNRLKFVRYGFSQAIETPQTTWLNRTIIPNKLDVDIDDLF